MPVLLILLALLISAVHQAHATDYWVSRAAANDSASCLSIDSTEGGSDPGVYRRTITEGIKCLASGDRLIIKAGTYPEPINALPPSGTSGNRTVIKAQSGGTVIVQPNTFATLGTSNQNDVWRIASRNFVDIGACNADLTPDGTLIIDGSDNPGTAGAGGNGISVSGTSQNVRWLCLTVRHNKINGFYTQDATNQNILVRGGKVHDNGEVYLSDPAQGGYVHGFYVRSGPTTVEHVDIYDNYGYGIHGYHGEKRNSGNIYRFNRIDHNYAFGIVATSGDNQQVYNNLLTRNGWGTVSGRIFGCLYVGSGAGSTNIQLWNNTCYNNAGYTVRINSNFSNTVFRNNIVYNPSPSPSFNNGVNDASTSSVFSNNTGLTTKTLNGANPLFENASAGNFNLQAGSPGLGTGANSPFIDCGESAGLACNTGAYQPPRIASCTVDGTSLVASWFNFTHPPLVSVTNDRFIARVAGSSRTINTSVLQGQTQSVHTLSSAVTALQAVTLQCTVLGCANAGAYLGGFLFAMSTPADEVPCTNITDGSPSTAVLTQTHYAVGLPDPVEDWRWLTAAANTPVTIPSPSAVHVRIKVENSVADFGVAGFSPYYSIDAGATKVPIPADPGADKIALYAQARLPNQTPLEERLTAASTYLQGLFLKVPGVTPQLSFTTGAATELAYALYFAPGITPGTVYHIYLKRDNDEDITWSANIPALTIGRFRALFASGAPY